MKSTYKCYSTVCIAVIMCVPIEFNRNITVTYIVNHFGPWPGKEVLEWSFMQWMISGTDECFTDDRTWFIL